MRLVLAGRNYKPYADFRSIRQPTCKEYDRGIVRARPVAVSREWLLWSTATADIGPPVAASLLQS
jgi:hypothetical protein